MTREELIKEFVVKALTSDDEDFEIEGKDFTVKCYYDGLHVWTKNGRRSLFSVELKHKDAKPEDYIDIITERIEEYCEGYIHCSECGEKFPVSEIEGYRRSYFAGVYCQRCWDWKWKDLEAKETYD